MPGFRHGCRGPNSGPQACTALYLVDHPQSHPTLHPSPPHPTTTRHVLPSVCFSWQCLCISLTKPPVFRRPLLLGVLLLLNRTVLGATREWRETIGQFPTPPTSSTQYLRSTACGLHHHHVTSPSPLLTVRHFYRRGSFLPTSLILASSQNSYNTGTLLRKHSEVTSPRSCTLKCETDFRHRLQHAPRRVKCL